jgi:hypothetical protein
MGKLEEFIRHVQCETETVQEAQDKIPLKNFSGKIIGYIYCSPNGDQQLTDYSGIILGKYVATRNATQNYSGIILSYGNTLTMLLKDTK